MTNVPRLVANVARVLERISKIADTGLDDLDKIKRAIGDGNLQAAARPPKKPPPPGPAPSAQKLHLDAMENGRPSAQFDGGEHILLTPTLAALLSILKCDDGEPTDEFVAWKSLDTIGKLLELQLLRPFPRHNVSGLLNRLRKVLEPAGHDRLIQSERLLGARVRIKRYKASVGAD